MCLIVVKRLSFRRKRTVKYHFKCWVVSFSQCGQKFFHWNERKSTFKHYLRWEMTFIDVLCIMPFVQWIFPYYSKTEMLYLLSWGLSGLLIGANVRNSVIHTIVALFPKLDNILRYYLVYLRLLFIEKFCPYRNVCMDLKNEYVHSSSWAQIHSEWKLRFGFINVIATDTLFSFQLLF